MRFFRCVILLCMALFLVACTQNAQNPQKELAMQAAPAQATKPVAFMQKRDRSAQHDDLDIATGSGSPSAPMSSLAPHTQQAQDPTRSKGYTDNAVKQTAKEPLSTFGLDVDTAAYAFARSFLKAGNMPPADAVRVEELLNYFPPVPGELALRQVESSPFAAHVELAPSPWNKERVLLSVTLEATSLTTQTTPQTNMVFLVDTSGSMQGEDRLELAKNSLIMLAQEMAPTDRIALVTYAGSTELVLPSTPASELNTIVNAIRGLGASGSTAGANALEMAYAEARKGFKKDSVNRIILVSDGDFNVGPDSPEALKELVKKNRDSGITLSVLGFGMGNFHDAMMSAIATVGNGNYHYIDSMQDARKVLQEERQSTLVTVAKDAKMQLEFNPAVVKEFRQIGYEKRALNHEDFNNDAVDSGDVGAGKRVTVLYELTLTGQRPSIDPPRYSKEAAPAPGAANANELAFLKLRWKDPGKEASRLTSLPILKSAMHSTFEAAGPALRFQAAVAAFGQKLRQSPYLAKTSWQQVATWAEGAKGTDPQGYRAEFIQLVRLAGSLGKTRK